MFADNESVIVQLKEFKSIYLIVRYIKKASYLLYKGE